MSFSSRHCFEACHFLLAFSTLPLHDAKNVAGISSAVGKGMIDPLRLNCRDVESRRSNPPGVPGSPSMPTALDKRLIKLGRRVIPSPSWLESKGGSASGLLRLILDFAGRLTDVCAAFADAARRGGREERRIWREGGRRAGWGTDRRRSCLCDGLWEA